MPASPPYREFRWPLGLRKRLGDHPPTHGLLDDIAVIGIRGRVGYRCGMPRKVGTPHGGATLTPRTRKQPFTIHLAQLKKRLLVYSSSDFVPFVPVFLEIETDLPSYFSPVSTLNSKPFNVLPPESAGQRSCGGRLRRNLCQYERESACLQAIQHRGQRIHPARCIICLLVASVVCCSLEGGAFDTMTFALRIVSCGNLRVSTSFLPVAFRMRPRPQARDTCTHLAVTSSTLTCGPETPITSVCPTWTSSDTSRVEVTVRLLWVNASVPGTTRMPCVAAYLQQQREW